MTSVNNPFYDSDIGMSRLEINSGLLRMITENPDHPLASDDVRVYLEKDIYLAQTFPEIEAHDFYYELFDEGRDLQRRGASYDKKGNVICLHKNPDTNVMHRKTLYAEDRFSDLDTIPTHDFAFMSPISYFGKANTLENARMMYALTFDLDGVDRKRLEEGLMFQIGNGLIPCPTFIVNSGHGVHLYYKFLVPIPMKPGIQKELREVKKELITLIWNPYTSNEKRQYQSINQGFRVVGTQSKFLIKKGNMQELLGEKKPKKGKEPEPLLRFSALVTAYRVGNPVTFEYLQSFVSNNVSMKQLIEESDEERRERIRLSFEEVKEKYPDWFERRIIKGEPPKQWAINRRMYEWWIRKIQGKVYDENGKRIGIASFGHRYWCIYTLAVLAVKCGVYDPDKNPNPVTEEELRKDAKNLMPFLNKLSAEPFTNADKNSALKIYEDKLLAMKLTKKFLEDQTGIPMPPLHPRKPKGERQKREWHLEDMRAKKERMKKRGQPFKNPEGRPSKKDLIEEWRKNNPGGKKVQCARELNISRQTVYKWWES